MHKYNLNTAKSQQLHQMISQYTSYGPAGMILPQAHILVSL